MSQFVISPGNYLVLKHNYISSLSKLFIFLSGLSIILLYNFPFDYFFFFNFVFFLDPLAKYAIYLLLIKIILFFSLVLNGYLLFKKYTNVRKFFNRFEILILFFFSLLGMIGMILSNDFIILYLSLELQSLGLYLLAASTKYLETAVESGIKYFILGAFASSLFLFGLSILYGFIGITSYDSLILYFSSDINSYSNDLTLVILGLLLILFGLLFKLAIFPFHQWLPDIYEGVDFIIVIFFALVSKLSIIYFFIKFFLHLTVDLTILWNPLIIFCIIGSILIGSISALFQLRIRKLLAFSSIVNMGYLLLILLLNNLFSIPFSIIFYINYLICIFILFSVFYLQTIYIKSGYKLKNILILDNLSIFLSYFKKDLIISLSIVIVLFSLFGLPPFLGFFSKFYLLVMLFSKQYYYLIFLIIIVSLISVFYYLRLMNFFYFNLNKFGLISYIVLSEFLAYSFVIGFFVLLGFLIYPNSLLLMSLKLGLHFYI